MAAQINDLVRMGDIETLFDLMENNDDWMAQLDAAEGLVKLGERGGLDYLYSALLVSNADAHFTGAYFILRKEITADDIAELDIL